MIEHVMKPMFLQIEDTLLSFNPVECLLVLFCFVFSKVFI